VSPLVIREIAAAEFDRVWPMFQSVIATGDTYSYAPDTPIEEIRSSWAMPPNRLFVAERDGRVVGCYRLAPNRSGLGDHVANGGYMVAADARGQGIASAMCEHSLDEARRIIERSFPVERFEPKRCDVWDAQYARFQDYVEMTCV
jgi:RimJ/RimL family protein N-acetyltransferase